MDRQELSDKLISNHTGFIEYINSLNEQEFMYTLQGKWTAGQQLDHILRAVKPVSLAFRLPGFIPRLLFGKPNRPGRSYGALVEKYKDKLQLGGRASGRFVPGPIAFRQREKLAVQLQATVARLSRIISAMKEEDLDLFILPHPLLGKLTLREMLYFTIYHVEHHLEQVKLNLGHETVQKDAHLRSKVNF